MMQQTGKGAMMYHLNGMAAQQQHQVIGGGPAVGMRLVAGAPQLLAPLSNGQQPQQQMFLQQQGAQMVQVGAANGQMARPQAQYVQLQQQPAQAGVQQAAPQVVYLQQQQQQQQQIMRPVQPMIQRVQQPQPAAQQQPAPGGQATPGATVLVNINGTLRQAVVLQNGSLLLMDSAKPMVQQQQQTVLQQPGTVQYVTLPQQAAQVQQQRVQMMLPQGMQQANGMFVQQQQPQQQQQQFVTLQQVQVQPVRSVAMATAPMASVGLRMGTMQLTQQQQQQPMLLAANGAVVQQAPQMMQAARPALQMMPQSQLLAAGAGKPTQVSAPQATPAMLLPQQQQQIGSAPVSASTIFMGAVRPPMAAGASPTNAAQPIGAVSSSALDLTALSAQQQLAASQQGAPTALVGVIGDARRSRTGSASSPQSPAASAPGSQPGSPPPVLRAGTPRNGLANGAPASLAGLAGLLGGVGDLSALGGKQAAMRLIAGSALEVGMSPEQAISAGLCSAADRDALAAAFAAEQAARGGSAAALPAQSSTPMSADAMLEGFGASGAPKHLPAAPLSDFGPLRGGAASELPGATAGMFNAFGFSLFGAGPADGGLLLGASRGLGGLGALSAAAKAVSDDGIASGAPDQLMPVAAATLKMPAAAASAAAPNGSPASAAAAMVAGLHLNVGDLTSGAAAINANIMMSAQKTTA